jgi:hypothetical protein
METVISLSGQEWSTSVTLRKIFDTRQKIDLSDQLDQAFISALLNVHNKT